MPATRLGTVWKDWRERRMLAARRRRTRPATSFSAISGLRDEQVADVVGGQRQQGAVGDRLGRGGAAVAVEHRQLAEDLPRPERRQRDRPAVGMFAGDAEAAFADDVAGVGAVALVEDARPGREGSGHGDLGEALQLSLLEIREERNAPQQLDRASALCP